MAFDISCIKAVSSAWPGPTPKRCDPQLFLAALGQVICHWKALNLGSLNMQFQQDWPKDKKTYSSLNFLLENLEKFRSTELDDAPLEGLKIFLYRSSLGRTSMENCRLAEWKYAIFSGTGRKTIKLRCSRLFLSMVSKHGLKEGYTFLFQYSSITRIPLESSRLGELKYAISGR